MSEELRVNEEISQKTNENERTDPRFFKIIDELNKRNEQCGNVADFELQKVIRGIKDIKNNTCGLISGNIGEMKCHSELEKISRQHAVLYNVELESEGVRTEIDAIVITNNCIFIIEIKNSKKDIFIDANGDFFRTGNCLHRDCNIAQKMDDRERLLRKALEPTGIENLKIFKILVFTNPNIEVVCNYHYIKICTCTHLPCFIDNFKSRQWYSYEDICTMMAAINEVKCPQEYRISINMDEFKMDFAVLLAKLETAENAENEPEAIIEEEITPNVKNDRTIKVNKKKPIIYRHGRKVIAAALGITFMNAARIGAKIALDKFLK